MGIIINLLVNGLAVFITAYFLKGGVYLDGFVTAIIVSVILSVVNVLVKPIINIFALPFTIITLGLFSFVINAAMIMLVDLFVPGFRVDSFWWALGFSLVLSLVNFVLQRFTK